MKNQLELALIRSTGCVARPRCRRRSQRAEWWFGQMRRAVASAPGIPERAVLAEPPGPGLAQDILIPQANS